MDRYAAHAQKRLTLSLALVAAGIMLWLGGCVSAPSAKHPPTVTTVHMGPARNSARNAPTPPDETTAVAPITNNDACAMRLHDISGLLLLYYATNHHLPPALDELRRLKGFDKADDFTCPVSHRPYLYDPGGMPAPTGVGGRIILCDAAPSHSNMRWAICIIEQPDRAALVTRIVAVPESFFTIQTRGG